jgi:hypothetical protein
VVDEMTDVQEQEPGALIIWAGRLGHKWVLGLTWFLSFKDL